jgi:N-acetylmuramoyl-L-alanine amidase
MARPTARGLLGIVVAGVFLLLSFSPGWARAPKAREAAAAGRIALAAAARPHGYQVQQADRGTGLTLTGKDVRMTFEAGSREATWNGYRLFLGEPPAMRGGHLTLAASDWAAIVRPLLAPAAAASPGRLQLVVIDPGHGGSDPGTENRALKLKEKTYTLDLARRLRRALVAEGYKVLLTRTGDTRLKPEQADDLRARAEKANRAGADLFISLHFNSLPGNATVRGVETYALTPAGQRSTAARRSSPADGTVHPGNQQDHWNMVLSAALHRRVVRQLAATDRGLKHARFAVLRPLRCPAALVEGGFLSSRTEAQKIRNAAYRQEMAEAISAGIGDYARQLRAAAGKEHKS